MIKEEMNKKELEEFAKEEGVVKPCFTCKYWASVNEDDEDGECGIGRGHITRTHYCADHTSIS